jgi:hypothetical protein
MWRNTRRTFLRLATLVAITAANIGGIGCYTSPRVAPAPLASALIVRNTSVFDVNVYAALEDGGREWLLTVPSKSVRALGVAPRVLQRGSSLVLIARSIGATREWTSNEVTVDANTFGILDLSATSTGDCSQSLLSSVAATQVQAALR